MRLDAHNHFWQYSENSSEYPWITDQQRILKQDYLPAHLEPAFVENGLHGGIAVQARQTPTETDYLLALADQSSFIKGVVGWIELTSDKLEEELSRYQGRVCGFRHQLEDEADDDLMLSTAFRRGISLLEQHGFTYDLLIRPRHLVSTLILVDKFPAQQFVIDHLAKPVFTDAGFHEWNSGFRQLAERDNVFCKLSGLVTEASPDTTGEDELLIDHYLPFLDCALEAFTPGRLMFGSDWPVCTLAATFDEVYDILDLYLQKLTQGERDQIMGGTAASIYGIED